MAAANHVNKIFKMHGTFLFRKIVDNRCTTSYTRDDWVACGDGCCVVVLYKHDLRLGQGVGASRGKNGYYMPGDYNRSGETFESWLLRGAARVINGGVTAQTALWDLIKHEIKNTAKVAGYVCLSGHDLFWISHFDLDSLLKDYHEQSF